METAGGVTDPRRLYNLLADARFKIRKNAKRNDPKKWPPAGVNENGDRDWRRCTMNFLWEKLIEEMTEVRRAILAIHSETDGVEGLRLECADVAAIAMMIADHAGAWDDLPPMPHIVCLCGSTRFGDAYRKAMLDETLNGNIVLTVGAMTQSDPELIHGGVILPEIKEELDELHKRKIDLADEILVLNVGGYIGRSTRGEIEYATAFGKSIRYLEATE